MQISPISSPSRFALATSDHRSSNYNKKDNMDSRTACLTIQAIVFKFNLTDLHLTKYMLHFKAEIKRLHASMLQRSNLA